MNEQKRILGIIYVVWGLFDLFVLILAMIFVTRWLPLLDDGHEVLIVSDILKVVFLGLIVFKSVPCIVGGWGLLNGKKWAETLVLIIGCIALFFFPIGTAIGVFTIYVYVQDRKKLDAEAGESTSYTN